jgi:hypothetical protein
MEPSLTVGLVPRITTRLLAMHNYPGPRSRLNGRGYFMTALRALGHAAAGVSFASRVK